jgi:hypothetical protein
MIELFTVYAIDVDEDGYGLHVDVKDVLEPDLLKRIAKEVSDSLNEVDDDEFPEVDGPTKSWVRNEDGSLEK